MRRASARGSKRRRQTATGGVSLFPFLAVLICTMGALIVLLIVTARHARVQAGETARAEAAKAAQKQQQSDQQLDQQREDLAWRIELLRESLEKTRKQLTDAKLALGHVEDHSRRLTEKLAQLREAWKQLQQQAAASDTPGGPSLEQTQAEIARLEAELVKIRSEAQRRRGSYAVVPYAGPNGTHRRPIYLECRADSVILQPEGVRLVESDFTGPLGPGNPLASVLRAVREEWLREGAIDPSKAGEPYPLLLVRPSGIRPYQAARAAMRTWNSEFGYELVDEDWDLSFGQADPGLARQIELVLEDARRRQQRLMELARLYQSPTSGRRYAVTSRHGGLVELGGPSGGESPSWEKPGWGGGSSSDASGVGGAGGSSEDSLNGSYGNNRAGEGPYSAGSGNRTGQGAGASARQYELHRYEPGGSQPGGSAHKGSQPGGSRTEETQRQMRSPDSYPQGSYPSDTNPLRPNQPGLNPPGQAATGTMQPGGSYQGQPGQSPEFRAPSPESQAPSFEYEQGQSGQGQPGQGQPGQGQPDQRQPGQAQSPSVTVVTATRSMADRRGPNWALPGAMPRYTPISHPIRIDCYPDRLVFAAQRGQFGGKTIPLDRRTEDSVDALTATVSDVIQTWGSAGDRMYWRPVLYVYTAPGAEGRTADLEILLRDSGLLVERKGAGG
ncbi:MAG: hypothetical protein JW818_21855 [Pirellulales bacterium]|nr:hypothetical protein [Pirellulales bacterium]